MKPKTIAPLLAAAVASLVPAACSSSLPASEANAPVLSIATGLWPLAQAATLVGGNKVVVEDIVPAGSDPFTYHPGAAQTKVLQGSGLVLQVGGGLQPAIEAASAGAPAVDSLPSSGATGGYPWLDPSAMASVIGDVAGAMEKADPAAAPLFRRNTGGAQAEVQSVGTDYSSILSTCPGTTIVTPDHAFATMAADYGLKDVVAGPSLTTGRVSSLAAGLETGTPVVALTEPWVDNSGVTAVAATADLKTHNVDTLASAPTSPAGGAEGYVDAMEQDLGTISSALGCNPNEQ